MNLKIGRKIMVDIYNNGFRVWVKKRVLLCYGGGGDESSCHNAESFVAKMELDFYPLKFHLGNGWIVYFGE